MTESAAAKRDRVFGRRITYSPKIFLPLTNLCRDVCDYCTFRRSPKDPGAYTMSPDDVDAALARGRAAGCTEALFCLGDRPEAVFPSYRTLLASWGHGSTVDYLVWACRRAIDAGLSPHTNAGVLTREEMARLRPVNASLGLMLESTSERLCGKGMPHHRAPDKRPAVRLKMTAEAGELRIPFTSGILVGIGETEEERVDALNAIRDLHRRYGHIQEVIVQRFRAHPGTSMSNAPEPDDDLDARTIALARTILDDEVTVQAPPNLSGDGPEPSVPREAPPYSLGRRSSPGGAIERLIAAGVNDLGGISPVTPDFVNPAYAWPHLDRLRARIEACGYTLEPRLPVHERFRHLLGAGEGITAAEMIASSGEDRRPRLYGIGSAPPRRGEVA